MVLIRLRVQADLPGCAEVLRHVYADTGYPVNGTDHAEEFLDDASVQQAWVAEADGNILGHVSVGNESQKDVSIAIWRKLHPDQPVATLGRLFVHPQWQGNGVSRQLMNAATGWSRETGVQLVLFALIKDQPAIGMYRKLGWTDYATTTYSWGDGKTMEALCFAGPAAA